MVADKVEASWDAQKKKWLVRITVGEEVIRRHLDISQSAARDALVTAVKQVSEDEGYSVNPASVSIAT